MSIQANKQNAISLQVAIEEYFRDNNLDEEITDYDFGNDTTTKWYFFCKGDDFKYIDDNELHAYIEDLKDFRNEEFEVFSYRDEISVKILGDEFEESKKSARKSIRESNINSYKIGDITIDYVRGSKSIEGCDFSCGGDHGDCYADYVSYDDDTQELYFENAIFKSYAKINKSYAEQLFTDTIWYYLSDGFNGNELVHDFCK